MGADALVHDIGIEQLGDARGPRRGGGRSSIALGDRVAEHEQGAARGNGIDERPVAADIAQLDAGHDGQPHAEAVPVAEAGQPSRVARDIDVERAVEVLEVGMRGAVHLDREVLDHRDALGVGLGHLPMHEARSLRLWYVAELDGDGGCIRIELERDARGAGGHTAELPGVERGYASEHAQLRGRDAQRPDEAAADLLDSHGTVEEAAGGNAKPSRIRE